MGASKDKFGVAFEAGDVVGAARALGFSVRVTPVEGPALRAWGLSEELLRGVGRLRVLAAQEGFRLLHIDGEGDWRRVRQVLLAVERAAPEATVLWWWTSSREWTAAMVHRRGNGERRIKKLVVERAHPDKAGLLQWRALSPGRRVDCRQAAGGPESGVVLTAEAYRDHFLEVLDQEGVTREFFEGFSKGLERLIGAMEQGPEDDALKHEVALSTLLRVVFLYFLQARGALDGDRRFVMRRFREARKESFYRGVLRPLFFGALNCPEGRRSEEARRLGELPFLNGGLFEPGPVERAFEGLDFDDRVWGELLENLFERHRFAVEWEEEDDLCRAVDPEMLGKVFEGLMYGDRRRRSGSFYTPRAVVRQMVRESLGAWFVERAEISQECARAVLRGEAALVSAKGRRRVREALASLTVLDPAVGTGAFLLEVLRVLLAVERGLDEAECVVRTPGERYEQMRRLVHDHLFGVDVQPTAVRLCELRIWLAMLAALPELPAREMPPLPNLSHRLCAGNALVEPLDWVRYSTGAGREGAAFVLPGARFERRSVERLALLQKAYSGAHGEEKAELRRTLVRQQQKVEREILESRKQRIDGELEEFSRLSATVDLFGEERGLNPEEERRRELLVREQEALLLARADLEGERRAEAAFSFDAHFAPVMARGGFELVITNPPWVRSGSLDRATKKLYKARFRCDDHRLWPGAEEIGVRATFGAQVDMAGLFLERSLELLRPGGRLCALVPVKLFRSLHGAGLRGLLASHTVEYLEDRSEDGEPMFDATTYPAILRVRKAEERRPVRESRPVEVSVWRGGRGERFSMPLRKLCVFGGDEREPWMMVPPEVEAIFRKMQARSRPLGSLESMPVRRGVMTGCNKAFLLRPEEAKKFSKEVRERYLRWAVQGRDLGGEVPEKNLQILWPVDERGETLQELPKELEEHFASFEGELRGRSDYRGERPIWELFRCHEDIEGFGVAWRDMGPTLQATLIDAEAIPLNTVYYVPAASDQAARALVALFHSEAVRAMAFAVAERARGGWRRHFAWVMSMLPVPLELLKALESGEVVDDAFVVRAFGLSSEEVGGLRRFRRGPEGAEGLREVA